MDKLELLELLKEHLKIDISLRDHSDFYSSGIRADVVISFDSEIITSSSDFISIKTD